jgi:predicted polyphosphate/ATP-dependent NAD kinase
VFDNAEKGHMVYRLMVGLGAVGVERVIMMPAGSGLSESLSRTLRSHPDQARPELELLDLRSSGGAGDTVNAVAMLRTAGVAAIAVLGGDGTSRLVARHCGDIPLCPLSTGTNNAFPAIREATVAGLALGLLATGQVEPAAVLRRAKLLRVAAGQAVDCALVDVALSSEPWVGARALWRPGDLTDIVVAFGEPGSVGLSAIAGLVDPVGRHEPAGVHLQLAPPGQDGDAITIRAPIAPGLVLPVRVAHARRLGPGETVTLDAHAGSVALDGERELELPSPTAIDVTLDLDGPLVLDVDLAMRTAASAGLLRTGRA